MSVAACVIHVNNKHYTFLGLPVCLSVCLLEEKVHNCERPTAAIEQVNPNPISLSEAAAAPIASLTFFLQTTCEEKEKRKKEDRQRYGQNEVI